MGLIDSLATTDALAKLFSDGSVLAAMLRFEAALAMVEGRLGIVPKEAAGKIAAAAQAELFDAATLAKLSLRGGTPAIPLVKALREKVRVSDPNAADFVHWGATSQDVVDTALILLLKQAQAIFESDLVRLENSLRDLSDKHSNTVMLGRTLMQPAPPITFGLKVAGWLGGIHRSQESLSDAFTDALVLQFGGASGTLALLGDKGITVGEALACELKLAYPEAPWHTQRDRLAALMCACGVLTGALGKMARDISLLMQAGIGEVAEGGDSNRGGSSTMPHKQNPIGCALTLAAATRAPGLVAAFIGGMTQEHERGAGGWHAEWATVAAIIQATGLAIESMAEVIEGLTVDSARMLSNLNATNGTVFAEKAMLILAPHLGQQATQQLLDRTTRESLSTGRHLSDVLAGTPEIKKLPEGVLHNLEIPELYLGMAEGFRKRALGAVTPHPLERKNK